jgi:uncharacterized membrane protein
LTRLNAKVSAHELLPDLVLVGLFAANIARAFWWMEHRLHRRHDGPSGGEAENMANDKDGVMKHSTL